jgi:hypothetical protein
MLSFLMLELVVYILHLRFLNGYKLSQMNKTVNAHLVLLQSTATCLGCLVQPSSSGYKPSMTLQAVENRRFTTVIASKHHANN